MAKHHVKKIPLRKIQAHTHSDSLRTMFCAHHAAKGYVSDRGVALLNHAPRASISQHGSVVECFEHLVRSCGVARSDIYVLDTPDSRATATESLRRMSSGSFVCRSTPAARFRERYEAAPACVEGCSASAARPAGAGGGADTEIFVRYERHRWPDFSYAVSRSMQTVMQGVLTVPRSVWPKSKRSPSKCGAACVLVAVVALSECSCATAVRVSDLATYNALVRHAPAWIRGGARKTRTPDAELVVRTLGEIQSRGLDIRPPRASIADSAADPIVFGDGDQTAADCHPDCTP